MNLSCVALTKVEGAEGVSEECVAAGKPVRAGQKGAAFIKKFNLFLTNFKC